MITDLLQHRRYFNSEIRRLRRCINPKAIFIYANNQENEEGYPAGVNAMFYKLFFNAEIQQFDYIFWYAFSSLPFPSNQSCIATSLYVMECV